MIKGSTRERHTMTMKKIQLCPLDEKSIRKLLEKYRTNSRADWATDVGLYIKCRFEGFSTVELAEMEHLSRYTVYRKIKRVDSFLHEKSKENNGDL